MSSKTTVKPADPSPEERALQAKQLELATFQLEELQKQSELQAQFAGDIGPLLEQQAADAQQARERGDALFPIQEELLQLALEDIRRGGAATPEQIELIQQAGDAALERGGTDIERFRTESLDAIRNELAPSLGLRPSDTPILDRGARVAAEATRQGGQLAAGIRGAEASAQLNFPLAQSQLLQASTFGQQSIAEATRQFQDQLRNAAFTNRLNLQSNVGGLGLGLATGVQTQFPGFQRGQTSTTGGLGLSGIGSLISGAGGLLSGLGATGIFGGAAAGGAATGAGFSSAGLAAAIGSSRDFKTDFEPVDEDEVLDKIEELPIEKWRYRPSLGLSDGRPHVGPMAQDFKRSFETLGLGDDEVIPVVDAVGVTLAGVKALAKKVSRLEDAGGLGLREVHETARAKAGTFGLGLTANAGGGVRLLGLRAANDSNGLGVAA